MRLRVPLWPVVLCGFAIGLFMTLATTEAYCGDIATVIKLNTVLRETPSQDGAKIMLLKKKAVLALIDREDTDGWLNVIHIKTGKEGWVNLKHVSLKLSETPNPQPVFNEQKIEDNTNPEIELTNASNKNLTLKVGETRFEVPSHWTKIVSIIPGDYKYYASAPDVFPALGQKDFKSGYRYTWKFWIESRRK